MVSVNENSKLKRMYGIVKREGILDRTALQEMCGHMPISTYNKLLPYFLEKYEGNIEYDKQTKTFRVLHPDNKEIEETIEKFLQMRQKK